MFSKNFRIPGHATTRALPEIKIKKKDDDWVHHDSGWRTELSQAVGEALDKAGVTWPLTAPESDFCDPAVGGRRCGNNHARLWRQVCYVY
jgi:hypothetical protein